MTSMASTSLVAYKSLDVTEREREVLEVIENFGIDGCIFDQVQSRLPHLPNSVSGRFLTLERKGEIYRNGETRPGKTGNPQKVMRHAKYLPTVPMLPVACKKKQNPFVKGMMAAAKILIEADPSFKGSASALKLKTEIIKAARR